VPVAPPVQIESINTFLAQTLTEILNLEEDLTDETDLYTLGVGSLAATQIISRMNENYNIDVSIADLYSQTTIGDLKKWLYEELHAAGKIQESTPGNIAEKSPDSTRSVDQPTPNESTTPAVKVEEKSASNESTHATDLTPDLSTMVDFYAILNKKKHYVVPSKLSTFGPFLQPNLIIDPGYPSHILTLQPGQIKELAEKYAKPGYFWKVKGNGILRTPILKLTSVGDDQVPPFYAVIAPDIRGGTKIQLPYLRYSLSRDDTEFLLTANPASLQQTELDLLKNFRENMTNLIARDGDIQDGSDVGVIGQTVLGQRIVVSLNKAALILKTTGNVSQNLSLAYKLAHLAYDEGSRHLKKNRNDDLWNVKI